MNWHEAAAQVRRYRRQARLTQAELAERLGVSTTTIFRLEKAENDDPPHTRPQTLLALADLMDDGAAFLENTGHGDLVDELHPADHVTVPDEVIAAAKLLADWLEQNAKG